MKNIENVYDRVECGDIFYTSWGYDQTNVEFYLVIGRYGKTGVVIQEIGCDIVPGSDGMDCCDVTPNVSKLIKDPFKKRMTRRGDIKISDCQTARLRTSDRTHYKSWYC